MNRIRFYIASAIRGKDGNDATMEQMNKNIQQAIKWAEYLREQLPGAEFYSPHEHEELFQQAWNQQLIDSDMILKQSKAIVRLCDVVLIMTDPDESEGIRSEINEARLSGLGIISLFGVEKEYWLANIEYHIDDHWRPCNER